MLFNSYKFAIFFIVVVGAFLAMPQRFRWLFLLIASYFYYMCWDPKYALLILTTTTIVYGTALLMHNRSARVKKLCVALSVVSNLTILFMFKYFNFFNNSLKELFSAIGVPYAVPALNLLLPVGISFYTFQALSYTIDVYRGTREPERHFGIFALYVSFFPVLLSGPIERSTTLLPQFYEEKRFDYSRITDGLKLMAWGFFQKFVIADRLGQYVNVVYGDPQSFHGLPLLLGTYLFVVQVYCDFSGYTDVAIGSAQVMGFRLMPNFRRPYFASSLGELWRRWHISLISWFRDYLYIPLGGNRVPTWRRYINMIIVFTLSGLWHGAQWTFVIWGSMNGVMLIISRMTQRGRDWLREKVFGGVARIPAATYFVLSAALAALALWGGITGVIGGVAPRIAAGVLGMLLLVLGVIRTRDSVYAKLIENIKKLWMVFVTFHLFVLGAVFFRSKSVADAWYILTHFPGTNVGAMNLNFDFIQMSVMLLLVLVLNVIHLIQEQRGSIRDLLRPRPAWIRWILYVCLCTGILMLGVRGTQQFIYFRF
jgi:D-alanyl-lipoteichoic acid acyltransferase DltB (MBOAT superfamily)